jgi:hypothetical protein
MRTILVVVLFLAVMLGGCAMSEPRQSQTMEQRAPGAERVFELRTYTASPGKLDALHARFRDHTNALFARHGMTVVAFFTPTDERQKDTLIYLLAFPDPAARERSWQAFRGDPEWQRVKAASEVDGPLTVKIESVVMKPTDYSPMR